MPAWRRIYGACADLEKELKGSKSTAMAHAAACTVACTVRTAEESSRLKQFEKDWEYDGDGTCAAAGMCEQKCPVKINTGAQSVLAFFFWFFFLSFVCVCRSPALWVQWRTELLWLAWATQSRF